MRPHSQVAAQKLWGVINEPLEAGTNLTIAVRLAATPSICAASGSAAVLCCCACACLAGNRVACCIAACSLVAARQPQLLLHDRLSPFFCPGLLSLALPPPSCWQVTNRYNSYGYNGAKTSAFLLQRPAAQAERVIAQCGVAACGLQQTQQSMHSTF